MLPFEERIVQDAIQKDLADNAKYNESCEFKQKIHCSSTDDFDTSRANQLNVMCCNGAEYRYCNSSE